MDKKMKPILFNTAMVNAILDGRKTVTRRVIKPQPELSGSFWKLGGAGWSDGLNSFTPMPYHSLYNRMPCKPCDILYVRETWTHDDYDGFVDYRANFTDVEAKALDVKWKPSIHIPKEAARIFLMVTNVRAERLQEITHDQAKNEGADGVGYRGRFIELWDSTIKKKGIDTFGWDANPWVWVIEFERISKEAAHDS